MASRCSSNGRTAATLWDADGRVYVDYVGSWGPMILGHAHPKVLSAIQTALRDGTSFGAPTAREVELAEALAAAFPSIEMVRLVSSGTEAAMTAIRLARGFTGRTKILKFAGCYHGHADALLVRAGSGAATFGVPDSAGVPEAVASHTLVAELNDLAQRRAPCSMREGEHIAAVIIEPVVGNMGVIPPHAGFLEALREATLRAGALLIFDEVITGFRLGYGGVQTRWALIPTSPCLGKIVGGGLPLAAFGGKREIMEQLAPLGPVYQAGTLSGNPLAVAAGLQTLELLAEAGHVRAPRGARRAARSRLRAALAAHADTGVHQSRRLDVDGVLRRRGGARRADGPRLRHRALRAAGSAACWSAGSTCRPRSSRRRSSRWRTARRRSRRPSARRAR